VGAAAKDEKFTTQPYKAKLGLDYLGQPTLSLGTDPTGAFLGGGMSMLFSDVLGNHTLGTAVQINGRFETFGAIVGYENRTHRWAWGAQLEQIPYLTGGFSAGLDVTGRYIEVSNLFRETDRLAQAYIAYPLSRAQRVELAVGGRNITYGREVQTLSFDPVTGQLLSQNRQELAAPASLTFAQGSVALAYDTSVFGPTSPILGRRYRFEVTPTLGQLNYTGVLADIRQYVMPVRPITIAGRLLHFGRYGSGAEDPRMTPLYIGYPTLVRGYDVNSYSASECGSNPLICPAFDQLVGSRIAVANLELRLPVLGLFNRRNLYGPVPIELIGFADWGVAWTAGQKAQILGGTATRPVVKSYGAGARVNVLGFAVLEMDAVKPVDRPLKGWTWVFNFSPGF
jgi:hypothetical protein